MESVSIFLSNHSDFEMLVNQYNDIIHIPIEIRRRLDLLQKIAAEDFLGFKITAPVWFFVSAQFALFVSKVARLQQPVTLVSLY